MATELHALVPSRQPLGASHAGAGYLRRAGFNIHELVGHASIFEAYSAGVLRAAPSDSSIVLLVHDDVEFDLPHTDFVALLRSQLDDAGVGFVGAAGTRNLSRELVWWRGAPSRTTLAGLVHHGASRAFFGPYGGVVMLDGLFLAARGRTLRAVRLGPPAALRRAPGWHFYDASYCLQATAAGLLNVALPLGLRHASRGVTDERWEAARAALALRLRPALPRSVGALATRGTHRRIALLLPPPPSETFAGGDGALREALRSAGYELLQLRAGGDGGGGRALHPFRLVESIALHGAGAGDDAAGGALATNLDELGELGDEDTLLVASGASLPLTPPADIDLLLEAALRDAAVGFAAPLGCRAWCEAPAAGDGVEADVGAYLSPAAAAVAAVADEGSASVSLHTAAAGAAPAVDAFARSGLVAGKLRAFRRVHRDAASRAAPLRDALRADDAEAALPYEQLYARLAARAGLAAAVAPIVSVHLAPCPAGRCAPHAAALPAALRAVLCV